MLNYFPQYFFFPFLTTNFSTLYLNLVLTNFGHLLGRGVDLAEYCIKSFHLSNLNLLYRDHNLVYNFHNRWLVHIVSIFCHLRYCFIISWPIKHSQIKKRAFPLKGFCNVAHFGILLTLRNTKRIQEI